VSEQNDTSPFHKTAADMEARARDLFDRAKQANDPDSRDILSAAAWYYADKAEAAAKPTHPPHPDAARHGSAD